MAGLAFNRFYKPLLDKLGLTYLQYLAVVLLRTRDGQTVGELGEQLFLDSSTLTPLLKRLETGGLVERRRDAADERVVRITLTARGREIAAEAACIPDETLRATGLTMARLADLEAELVALRGQLGSYWRDKPAVAPFPGGCGFRPTPGRGKRPCRVRLRLPPGRRPMAGDEIRAPALDLRPQ